MCTNVYIEWTLLLRKKIFFEVLYIEKYYKNIIHLMILFVSLLHFGQYLNQDQDYQNHRRLH